MYIVSLSPDDTQDIDRGEASDQNEGFKDLVIPESYKKIVKALVANHALDPDSTETNKLDHQCDIVRGKGKGLIILLYGVPGVGKTSTAESVAAYTKRPLFSITCGDLGQTAIDVESNLEKIFHLARKCKSRLFHIAVLSFSIQQ